MSQPGPMLQPGHLIGGRYQIIELLGTGGFGAVYRATQADLGREVALKVLLDLWGAQGEVLARFRREAKLAQRLEHPNTVRLYDFGCGEDGVPFIAYELLRGRPLDKALSQGGPMSAQRVVRIGTQVLKSLAEAHQAGIVHRDIKPANIFVCEHFGEPDFVKVLDFGIAKQTDAAAITELTVKGQTVGSPSYMAPEQVSGEEITPATDTYSLGLVMAEALSGRVVYRGKSAAQVCSDQISDAPTPLESGVLQSELGPVLLRATQKTPARRFTSASEMLKGIELVAKGLTQPHVAIDATAKGGGAVIDAGMTFTPTQAFPTGAVAGVPSITAPFPTAPLPEARPVAATRPLATTRSKSRSKKKTKGQGCLVAILLIGGVLLLGGLGGVLYLAGVFDEIGLGADERAASRGDDDEDDVKSKKKSKKSRDADDDDTDDGGASKDAKKLKKRINKAGWEITAETNSNAGGTKTTSFSIQRKSKYGSVSLIEYQDKSIARQAVKAYEDNDDMAASRDGGRVLLVYLTAGDSEDLLEELAD